MLRVRDYTPVAAWVKGQEAKTRRGTFWTDGNTLYSYNLPIGYKTEDGLRVVKLYVAPFAFRSRTTSSHVGAALQPQTADLVENPITGEVRRYRHEEPHNTARTYLDDWPLLVGNRTPPSKAVLRKCVKAGVPAVAVYAAGFWLYGVKVPPHVAEAFNLLHKAGLNTRVEARILREVAEGRWPQELEVIKTMNILSR